MRLHEVKEAKKGGGGSAFPKRGKGGGVVVWLPNSLGARSSPKWRTCRWSVKMKIWLRGGTALCLERVVVRFRDIRDRVGRP